MKKPPAHEHLLIEKIRDALNERGWKKNAWYNYAYMESDKGFILSIWVRWNGATSNIESFIMPINVLINQASDFMAKYANKVTGHEMRKSNKNYNDNKISITQHLRGQNTCDLLACSECISFGDFNNNEYLYVEYLIGRAQNIFDQYRNLDKIIEKYEFVVKEKNIYIKPLIYAYFVKGEYHKTRYLLNTINPNTNETFFDPGLRMYLDDNRL